MLTNLAPFWRIVDPFAVALASLIGASALSRLCQLLKVSSNSKLRADFAAAIGSGVNLAVDWFRSVEAHNSSVRIPSDIMSNIVSTVIELLPEIETKLKISPDTVSSMIQAGFTQWLHWNTPQQLQGIATLQPLTPAPASPDPSPAPAPAPAPDPSNPAPTASPAAS